ncbi:uncharacterized protein LOC110726156 [Chenopodium quinoa]|uniref:uncharacterized protein LOC110726156 n=1 Tax=Chenopodium quinoa TaxID=63459 RepID=UPI000B78C407|nr:uncharacterized protein LOC110726156 [Chenopodium quinoa]
MRTVALFSLMLYLHLALSTASPSSHTSFSSAELQEKNHTENVFVQNIRTGHGGGEGGSGRGGSAGDVQQGRPLNGAGNVNSRNHQRHGAGVHTSNCNFSMLIVFISLSLVLLCFL